MTSQAPPPQSSRESPSAQATPPLHAQQSANATIGNAKVTTAPTAATYASATVATVRCIMRVLLAVAERVSQRPERSKPRRSLAMKTARSWSSRSRKARRTSSSAFGRRTSMSHWVDTYFRRTMDRSCRWYSCRRRQFVGQIRSSVSINEPFTQRTRAIHGAVRRKSRRTRTSSIVFRRNCRRTRTSSIVFRRNCWMSTSRWVVAFYRRTMDARCKCFSPRRHAGRSRSSDRHPRGDPLVVRPRLVELIRGGAGVPHNGADGQLWDFLLLSSSIVPRTMRMLARVCGVRSRSTSGSCCSGQITSSYFSSLKRISMCTMGSNSNLSTVFDSCFRKSSNFAFAVRRAGWVCGVSRVFQLPDCRPQALAFGFARTVQDHGRKRVEDLFNGRVGFDLSLRNRQHEPSLVGGILLLDRLFDLHCSRHRRSQLQDSDGHLRPP